MLHKKYVNRGFTLVELLAVIVILAIILVIAVPKIMDVINSSKKSTLETSAKMIASSVEKMKLQNKLLGKEDEEITCDSVAKLSSKDYSNCTITFNNNEAIVSINGIGKFNGINVCNATKNKAETSEDKCPTDGRFFTYDTNIDEDAFVYSAEVIDVGKCTSYLVDYHDDEEYYDEWKAVCEGTYDYWTVKDEYSNYRLNLNSSKTGIKVIYKKITDINVDKCTAYLNVLYPNTEDCPICEENNSALCNETYDGYTIKDAIKDGIIPEQDYETAGLTVSIEDYTPIAIITGYDVSGGTDVIIPKEIDGYKVEDIKEFAMYKNDLSSVEVLNNNIIVGNCAFGEVNQIKIHNLTSSYKCDKQLVSDYIENIIGTDRAIKDKLYQTNVQYNDVNYNLGIRYIGDDAYNYVYFNCDDESDTSTCEIWKIVGVFDVEDENGNIEKRVKLVKFTDFYAVIDKSESNINSGLGINQWGPSKYEDGTDYKGSAMYQFLNGYYIGNSDTCSYYGPTSNRNDEKLSCTKESLIEKGIKPLTESAMKLIDKAKWYTYGVNTNDFESTFISNAGEIYLQEMGISTQYTGKSRCESSSSSYCNDKVVRTTSAVDYVGLLNASDSLYLLGTNSYRNNIYTLTPHAGFEHMANYFNYIYNAPNYHVGNSNYNHPEAIYPSVYLKHNVIMIATGDGSINNPYELNISS